jgi:hypothetical protein
MLSFATSGFGGNVSQEASELSESLRLKSSCCPGFSVWKNWHKKIKQLFGQHAKIVDPLLEHGIACIGGGFNNPI